MAAQLKNIIESLLFVADKPLTVENLKNVLPNAVAPDIRKALADLMAEYQHRNGGFDLREVAGGFQFRTQPKYNEWIKRLVKPASPRLSKAALETLAIIAYKQPIIRNDIEHIRGVDSGGVIRMLLDRKLVRILGRKEIPGRPLIYATTRFFLEVFDLKSLKDLPTPAEIEAYGSKQAELLESMPPVAPESDAIQPPADILPPLPPPPETPTDAAEPREPQPEADTDDEPPPPD